MITSAFKIKSQTMFFFSNNIDKLPTLHRLYLHFTCSIIRFAKVPERTWWRYIRRCMRRRCLLLINSSKMYAVCGSLSILFTCFTIVRPTRTWPGSYAWISDWQELHVFFLYRLTYENCGGSKPFVKVSMWTFFLVLVCFLQYGVQLPCSSRVLRHSNILCQSHGDHDTRGPDFYKE